MPLPDAKPDRRIYELLKNTDLENITFSEFQGVAKTIFAEQGAEDELRRIVLLNLARLSVVGEWTGLTTAGGGGGGSVTQSPMPLSDTLSATYPYFQPTDMYKVTLIDNTIAQVESYAQFIRFVAPKTGTINFFGIRTNSNQSGLDVVKIGIYDSDTDGYPKDRLANFSIDVNGSSGLYSTSISVSVTAGETYYAAFCSAGVAIPSLSQQANGDEFLALGLTHYPGTPYNVIFNNLGTIFDIPATFDKADATLARQNQPSWVVKYS